MEIIKEIEFEISPETHRQIREHRNCGVITETIAENFLIKQTGDRALGRSTYRFTGIYVLDLVRAHSPKPPTLPYQSERERPSAPRLLPVKQN